MHRLLAIAALLACPLACLTAASQQPAPTPASGAIALEGKWRWVLTAPGMGTCEEAWDFNASALVAVSGEERLEKSYDLTPGGPGQAWLLTTVTATNGKPDCIGKTSAKVGFETEIFLRKQDSGRILTCLNESPGTCLGELRPLGQPTS